MWTNKVCSETFSTMLLFVKSLHTAVHRIKWNNCELFSQRWKFFLWKHLRKLFCNVFIIQRYIYFMKFFIFHRLTYWQTGSPSSLFIICFDGIVLNNNSKKTFREIPFHERLHWIKWDNGGLFPQRWKYFLWKHY